MSLIFIVSFLIMPSAAASAAKDALDMCLVSVIPALFPFMAAAKCAVLCGDLPEDNFVFCLVSKIFNIPLPGVLSLFFGLLCGYPVGAKTAFDLYLEGRITKKDALKLACFANNAGPAFVIAAVGSGFLKNTAYGVLIYLCHIFGSLAVGFIIRGKEPPASRGGGKRIRASLFEVIPAAVSDSVSGILNVSGTIIFFAVLYTVISSPLSLLLKSGAEKAMLAGFFEITSGIRLLSRENIYLPLKLSLICFLTGFSGLSVIFQTKAFAGRADIKTAPCVLCKLLSAFISSVLCFAVSIF